MEASPRLPLAASRVRQKITHPEEEMEGKGGKGRGGIQVRCQYSVSQVLIQCSEAEVCISCMCMCGSSVRCAVWCCVQCEVCYVCEVVCGV